MYLEVFNLLNKAQEEKQDQKKLIGEGFTINDKEEFKKVYNFLVNNGFNTSYYIENLKTLKLYKLPQTTNEKDAINVPAYYNHRKNLLEYTNEEFLGHELLHVASSKNKEKTGIVFIDNQNKLKAISLNEGISDYLQKNMFPEYVLCYPLQAYVTEILVEIYGKEILKPYFYADDKLFLSQFNAADKDFIVTLIQNLDNYKIMLEEVGILFNNNHLPNKNDIQQIKNNIKRIIIHLKKQAYLSKKIDMAVFNKKFIELFSEKEMYLLTSLITDFSLKDFIIDEDIKISSNNVNINKDKEPVSK